MTATAAPAQGQRRGPLRRVRDNLANPDKTAQTLLSGEPVKFRFEQSTAWSVIVGVLGACLVAGGYFLLFEQYWHIHIVIAHFLFIHHLNFNHGASLKKWWDSGMGFIHSASWYLYRHALRDLGEPAMAVMAAKTLLAKAKYWGVRVSTWRLVTAPFVLIVIFLALAVGATWLFDFGLPAAWAHIASATGHRGYTWDSYFKWAGKASLWELLTGFFVIGPILHRFWAPVGATLQGFQIDRSVDRAQSRGGGKGRVPLWEKLPLAPPVIRERFALVWRTNAVIKVLGSHRVIISVMLFLITVVTIVGIIAKFWIAHGHTFPYLAG